MKTTKVVCIARSGPVKTLCQRLLASAPGLDLREVRTSLGEALDVLDQHRPTVLVVEAALLSDAGPGLIRALQTHSPATRILLITDNMTQEELMPCVLAGAKGAVESGQLENFLYRAIQCLDRGESWISRRMVGLLLSRFADYMRGAGAVPFPTVRGT